MYGKVILTVIFFLVLLISYSVFIGTVDIHSYFFPSFQQPQSPSVSPPGARQVCKTGPPLRVYMYDLPRRFNVGMMDRRSNASEDEPVTAENLPPWPKHYGVGKQHSTEYWLMASLLDDGGGEEREAVRVLDPEMADAFYVPFFSSMSFNTHGHFMTDPETKEDHKLQVKVMDLLYKSKYWQRSGGRDHVIPMTHPNAFRFLRQEGGKVRAKLAKILVGYDDVHYEQSRPTTETIKASTQGMRSSKFCLAPAGDTPSSCRLFDAIVSHCVPVIVSDQIELPYEDELDYSQFSIFFSIKDAIQPGYMVDQLRQFPKERWTEMWKQLKKVSHHFEFQFPPKKDDAVNMLWRQVKRKLPGAQLAVHRSHRLKVPDWWRWRR